MAMEVSVVVAVYNPGSYLEGLVSSLLRQTLPPEQHEVIFVDDGSTDGSGERLDALASGHPHFRVIHIDNSGWPGRPRNVGLDAARGEYVYIVDHDDWLEPQALARIIARAHRNDADVVVPREVGHGFGVPLQLFARNVDDATLADAPLLVLLTPHKLFRRAMLEGHHIRFPEGRRRLEDHVFVMRAYFAARRISILADYPCYHWVLRLDRSNATHRRVDPVGYYRNVREILDIVDDHTDPGPARDRLYAHWLRNKTLHKLRGRRWFDGELGEDARTLYSEIRAIVEERFAPAIDGYLPARYRVVSAAVRADRLDLVGALAEYTHGLQVEVRVLGVESAATRLDLVLACSLADAGGTPVSFVARDEHTYWSAPRELAADAELLAAAGDVTGELHRSSVGIVLRHRRRLLEHAVFVPLQLEAHHGVTQVSGEVRVGIDLATVAAGSSLDPGIWDLWVLVKSCGWAAKRRLPGRIGLAPAADRQASGAYVTSAGYLSIRVRRRPNRGSAKDRQPRRGGTSASGRITASLRRVIPRPARDAARRLLKAVARRRS